MPKRLPPSDLDRQLGSSLQELQEILALRVHRLLFQQYPEDLWRLRKEGTPYDLLPEDLRRLQRQQALEALQDILGKGFRIERPKASGVDLAAVQSAAEQLLKEGEPLQAYDALQQGLMAFPQNWGLRQLKALCLLEGASPLEAIEELNRLHAEGHRDPGALGILARAHRELGHDSPGREARLFHYRTALALYEELLREGSSPWMGLHAATLALLTWDLERARQLASEVIAQCRDAYMVMLEKGEDAFWVLRVLAQASIIQGGWEAARPHVREVAEHGATRGRELAKLRHEARQLLRQLGEDPTELETLLPAPKVVVFAGHMIDFPDRQEPRFPPGAETVVARALRQELDALDAWSGFASAASGSQVLFHEAMQARGAETHVVLPYELEDFKTDSVAIRSDGRWVERFETVIAGARGLIISSPNRLDEGSIAFRYNYELLLGLASIRARQLHAELIPMVLWDGRPSEASGSVAATVKAWRNLGHEVRILDLNALADLPAPLEALPPRAPRAQAHLPRDLRSEVLVMLFADVVHFSQLSDVELPRFMDHFLGALSDLEAQLASKPLAKNTWGDGLFYVFSGLADAAHFAHALAHRMTTTRWEEVGLPKDLNLRIAIHAGPVFFGTDPVTGQSTCYGTHVNRAARIEPITPPGLVYVSRAFAALAAAQDIPGIHCEYVGRLPLAKGFGTFPMYLLQILD